MLNGDETYLYVDKTNIWKFKAHGNVRLHEFCLESISKDFTKAKLSEISLNGTVYDFLVDQCLIELEVIFNIHEYLIVKNNPKSV